MLKYSVSSVFPKILLLVLSAIFAFSAVHVVAFAQSDQSSSSETLPVENGQSQSFVALPYIWAVESAPDADFVITGYVPTTQFQEFIRVRLKDIETDTSQIADGAPSGFITEALAGIGALTKADQGRVAFNGSEWSIVAGVSSEVQRQAVINHLKTDGTIDAWKHTVEIVAPASTVASPYIWRVEQTEDEGIKLSGFVPTPQFQRFLDVRVGETVRNQTELADGAPEGFIIDVLAAVAAVKTSVGLAAGFDGENWFVEGVEEGADIEAVLSEAQTLFDKWVISAPVVAVDQSIVAYSQTVEAETQPESADVAEVVSDEGAVRSEEVEQSSDATPSEADTTAGAASDLPETKSEPVAATPKLYRFAANKSLDEDISLSGVVPADAARRYFGVIAGKVPTDGLYVYEGAPDGFAADATTGLRALKTLNEGQLLHKKGQWTLSGVAQTATIADAARSEISKLDNSANWTVELEQVPPIVICTEHVNELAAQNNILFNPGSARLADSSLPAIDELVVFLNECPDAIVHVEGHTDADGAEDQNLILSVARAEAVVNALIDRDVDASRLYAIGYGESLPIASNDTNAGKRENRRIVFKILDEHR